MKEKIFKNFSNLNNIKERNVFSIFEKFLILINTKY